MGLLALWLRPLASAADGYSFVNTRLSPLTAVGKEITNDPHGESLAESFAGEHADEPACLCLLGQPRHGGELARCEGASGGLFVLIRHGFHRDLDGVVLDATPTQLGGKGPAAERPAGVTAVDPGAGEGLVVDETDFGEALQHGRRGVLGDAATGHAPSELSPGAGLALEHPQGDASGDGLRICVRLLLA